VSMYRYAQWNRESLYGEVWKNAVSKVSETYGISDVALAKVCRKLKIPMPGRGYWAKKSAGHAVKTLPLPSFKNAPVLFRPERTKHPKPSNDSSDPELAKIAAVEAEHPPIPAAEHPFKEFIKAYEEACHKKGESTSPETEHGKWIEWARGKADWLDPLTKL